ncbi:MAG: hypothetical protein E3J54_00230 [Actinobacteria bacterium]|nr:MAG: hypothetical protein E3J54_00230 [Actinomycetota bacterium]
MKYNIKSIQIKVNKHTVKPSFCWKKVFYFVELYSDISGKAESRIAQHLDKSASCVVCLHILIQVIPMLLGKALNKRCWGGANFSGGRHG